MAAGSRCSWCSCRLPLLGALLALNACASGGQPQLPCHACYVGLLAPNYIEVWVESVDVVDRRGLVFEQVHAGVVAIQTPPDNSGNPSGWPQRVGAGSGKNLSGIDLPEIIFVRWQSLVEPQTYNVRINIPAWVREEMLKPRRGYCHFQAKWRDDEYRTDITIGLAPGGIAKVWVAGPCLEPLEVGRFEGAVSKLGPYDGLTEGEHYPLSDTSRAYIETHGVPYGSW
ncbi:hypothetical protein D3C78_558950 [compost metagenome]